MHNTSTLAFESEMALKLLPPLLTKPLGMHVLQETTKYELISWVLAKTPKTYLLST